MIDRVLAMRTAAQPDDAVLIESLRGLVDDPGRRDALSSRAWGLVDGRKDHRIIHDGIGHVDARHLAEIARIGDDAAQRGGGGGLR